MICQELGWRFVLLFVILAVLIATTIDALGAGRALTVTALMQR
jgi:hypothetical protein